MADPNTPAPQSAPAARPRLVRLCAGNGAVHHATRATLARSGYLKALDERWGAQEKPTSWTSTTTRSPCS